MLSNSHVIVDKEHRLRNQTPVNDFKFLCWRRDGASFAEVDAYRCYQIFI